MPKWGYSYKELDLGRTAKASGRDLRISPKAAREICKSISNMRLDEARLFLQEVIEKKKPVPYRRHNKEVPHRRGIKGWYSGRYPVKAATEVLKILNSLEANAEDRGLFFERLKIVHASAQRARIVKKFMPRAFGRSSPKYDRLSHIELIVEES